MAKSFETLNQISSASANSGQNDPTQTSNTILPTGSTLVGVRLYKTINGQQKEFIALPWNPAVSSKPPISTITFKESMFEGCMFGSIVLFDHRNWVDEFLFTGNEKLEIKFRIGTSEKVYTLVFHVYDARSITDESQTEITSTVDERVSLWKLEFISSQIFLPNYNQTVLEQDEDFVGKISGDSESLVETIYNRLGFNINKIDESRSGIWLKNDHISYPWMKFKGQVRIPQLLKYISNYAWNGENFSRYHADYFFWEDRDGWNFRSITKMLSPNGVKVSPSDGFIITIDKFNPKRILDFQILSEYNIQKLLDGYSLFSYYERYDPSYSNPYLDFLDSNDSFERKLITYNYHESYSNMVMIDDEKLIPDDFDASPVNEFGKIKPSARLDDVIYGYYSKPFMNTPTPVEWDTYGRGKSGSTPWTDKAWQPQYDSSELSFQNFKTIHQNIRKPLLSKRAEYAHKKNIKRKWEVYRCTVCCHENGALGSPEDIALLTNPGPIGGITYNALFGPDGLYSQTNSEYKIVAAGSFTDTLNYNINDDVSEFGLTLSYNLTQAPYDQTIGEFFNIKGPEAPAAYTKYVIERATNLYDLIIGKIESRVEAIDNFLGNVETYKEIADLKFTSALVPKNAPFARPIDLTQGFRYTGNNLFAIDQIPEWPVTQTEFGLVPHTLIPENNGVGQVVFGQNSNLNTPRSITFREVQATSSACCQAYCETGNLPPVCADVGWTPEICSEGCSGTDWIDPIDSDDDGIPNTTDPDDDNDAIPDTEDDTNEQGETYHCCCYGNSENARRFPPVCVTRSSPCPTDPEFNCFELECPCERGDICTACDGPSRGGGGDGIGGIPGPPGPPGPTGPTGPPGEVVYVSPQGPFAFPIEVEEGDIIPIEIGAYSACSNDPIIRGYIRYYENSGSENYSPIYLYAAPYLWDGEDGINIKNWSYFDYGTESGLMPPVSDPETIQNTKNCLKNDGCYNTTCMSSNALEALRRTVLAEKLLLSTEKELFVQLRDTIKDTYTDKWKDAYRVWHERKAFFFSKMPGESIFRREDSALDNLPLSLQNIKSIVRKEVKGSRYELLSDRVGITGASTTVWPYEIEKIDNKHPYYDQRYNQKGFITSRRPHNWIRFSATDATDDPVSALDEISYTDFSQYGPSYAGEEYLQSSVIHVGFDSFASNNKIIGNSLLEDSIVYDYGFAQSDLQSLQTDTQYEETFNFYNTSENKPPNIKKEEISSYIRVEFLNPIGLDTVINFNNGFVRDAGSEYFLPYIVNLTVGPMGRQAVKYNAAVIGMDPYGFDVAVKKIKDDLPANRKLQGIDKGNYYDWWNHDSGSVLSKTSYLTTDHNGMDLWPEIGFETEFPYYAYDPTQEDLHGGGFDLDFHMGGAYYFEKDSQDWTESLYHYGMSSGKQFDPLYRSSAVGSYILPNSYRKLKPHRSWWSLFVPRNLFIPIRFANMFKSPNTKSRDMFGGKALFTLSPNYWRTWYGSEFENWLSLNANNQDLINILEQSGLNYFIEQIENDSISAHNEDSAINGYFRESLMNYLSGNYLIYKPELIQEDLWKYDLSGETEYGLITPPVDTEYEFFDRNYSIQFSVISRSAIKTCESLGLKCANPNGPVASAGGCPDEPYCNCPAQNLKPTEKEPTYLELYLLEKELNECQLITDNLGESWLGCDLHNPDSPMSCNCPEQGENYKDYIAYSRTYATFWETPNSIPLVRAAQLGQLDNQKLIISVASSENVKIGSLVEIINPNDNPELTENQYKKISGKWLVVEIEHNMIGTAAYFTNLTLVRNSLHYSLNESKSPIAIFKQ